MMMRIISYMYGNFLLELESVPRLSNYCNYLKLIAIILVKAIDNRGIKIKKISFSNFPINSYIAGLCI